MDSRCRQLIALLEDYTARDMRETHSLKRLKRYLGWLDAPFDQTSDPTHITASAIVLHDENALVLHRHKRLGMYLQPGGHVDGLETPDQAAARELKEETGLLLSPGPLIHVDVHQGPRGHVHLDLRYRFSLPTQTPFAPAHGESGDVQLMPLSWVMDHGDSSLRHAVVAALQRP